MQSTYPEFTLNKSVVLNLIQHPLQKEIPTINMRFRIKFGMTVFFRELPTNNPQQTTGNNQPTTNNPCRRILELRIQNANCNLNALHLSVVCNYASLYFVYL